MRYMCRRFRSDRMRRPVLVQMVCMFLLDGTDSQRSRSLDKPDSSLVGRSSSPVFHVPLGEVQDIRQGY